MQPRVRSPYAPSGSAIHLGVIAVPLTKGIAIKRLNNASVLMPAEKSGPPLVELMLFEQQF